MMRHSPQVYTLHPSNHLRLWLMFINIGALSIIWMVLPLFMWIKILLTGSILIIAYRHYLRYYLFKSRDAIIKVKISSNNLWSVVLATQEEVPVQLLNESTATTAWIVLRFRLELRSGVHRVIIFPDSLTESEYVMMLTKLRLVTAFNC